VIGSVLRAPLAAKRPFPLLLLFLGIFVALGLPNPASGQNRPRNSRIDNCPDGSVPLTQTFDACFPTDCVTLNPLDWGFGGVPPGVIAVEKFDPQLGTLMGVDVQYKAQYVGDVCVDNTQPGCCGVVMDADLLSVGQPGATNVPPITGLIPFQLHEAKELTSAGFLLGSADGFQDCGGNPVGNMSTGDCTPGEDHFIASWDEEFSIPPQSLDQTADLVPWIKDGVNPDYVEYDTTAIGSLVGSFCSNLDSVFTADARVWLEVTYHYCPNQPPTCAADAPALSVCENDPVGIPIDLLQLVTDSDGCIDCSTFEIIDQPDYGGDPSLNYLFPQFPTCTGMGNKDDTTNCSDCLDCTLLYVPKPGVDFCARDQFTLRVYDDAGAFVECTILITVNEANDPPVANPDSGLSTCQGQPLVINVCSNDVDPDNNQTCGCEMQCGTLVPADVDITEQPSCGGTAVSIGQGRVRFTPAADYCGPASCVFKYRIRDKCVQTSDCKESLWSNETTVTVDVFPNNQPPVANPDTATTCEDQQVVINVCSNDVDPDNTDGCGCTLDCGSLTVADLEITQQPVCGGTAVALSGGRVRFTPPSGFCGGDLNPCTFQYRIRDNCSGVGGTCATEAWSDPTTVSVNVYANNTAPVANPDTATTCADEVLVVNVCANDTDADAGGCGCTLDCAGLTAADLDITQQPSCGGSAVALNGGRIRFTPPAGYCGPGSCVIRYRIRDDCTGVDGTCSQEEWSNETTLTVEVFPVNQAPVANDDEAQTSPGAQIQIDLCSNDTDPDNGDGCGCPMECSTLTPADIVITQQPDCGTVTKGAGGVVTFTAPSSCGTCTFKYKIWDNCTGTSGDCATRMLSNEATVSVDIIEPNLAPVAVDDTATVNEDTPKSIPVCVNDSDPNNVTGCGCPIACNPKPASDIVITRQPDCGGTAVPQTNGRVLFTPPPDYCGPCSFDYKIRDNCPDTADELWSNEATVTLNIVGINDPPVAVDDEEWTKMNTPVDIHVCTNDWDIDNSDPLGCGCTLDCPNAHVEITWWDPSCAAQKPTVDLNGTVTFIPAPNYIGTCQFGYKIWDTATNGTVCDFAEATVTIHIADPCEDIESRKPASLLIYPEFDNRDGIISVLTVGNTGPSDIRAHFVYRDEETCNEWDRNAELTPNDTLTLITNYHNPQHDRGYVYVYARCPGTNDAVAYNYLIGNLMVVDGLETFSFSVNPLDVRGIGIDSSGGSSYHTLCPSWPLTDLDGDDLLDLDGMEYELAMDQILIPRFLGQTDEIKSDLILIDLSGGGKFETTIDFQVYNDNEEAFSTEHRFTCWTRVPLLGISGIFSQHFLVTGTDHAQGEILGQKTQEAGWMRLDGAVATSSWVTIEDPAFLAVLVESIVDERWVADLPFYYCTQDNGALLPTTPAGDQD